jgi:hypothetical protein
MEYIKVLDVLFFKIKNMEYKIGHARIAAIRIRIYNMADANVN